MDVRVKDGFSEFSPGPSTPRFDPPIRPPEERSRIFFPVDKCWLLEKHEGQDEEIYARVDMDMGPARLRRKYTVVPHVRKATIFLTSEEASVFHDWFERILGVGQLRWTGLFHDIGRGLRWFEAEFTKPWEAELVPLGDKNAEGNATRGWKISIEVRLYGDGLIDKPGTDPSLTTFSANVNIPLVTNFNLANSKKFEVAFECPLTFSSDFEKFEVTFQCPLTITRVNPYALSLMFVLKYMGSASINGWERFEVNFSL